MINTFSFLRVELSKLIGERKSLTLVGLEPATFRLQAICIDGKTGVLCGQCINTLSIIFGTTECRYCSNLWFLTLVGYAAIGVILVTVLLFFRLTLSEGPLASIILTNNIIAVSTIDYLHDDNVFISGMRIFVSLMNLNLGFPLCFYDGMTTAIKTGLQFIFPV